MQKNKIVKNNDKEASFSNSVIRFENIFFSYDFEKTQKYNLNDVSFNIDKNEYICVVGHNGSGKSTISKVVSCLVKPMSGNYYINNTLVSKENYSQLRKNIGIIFQNPDNQFIGITTEDDIAFGLENYCVRQDKMKMIIDNTASIIGINDLLDRQAFSLSGGQKQKVAITSVLALIPSVIIFDESTSMLDPQAKTAIKELMKFLQINYNKTIISITHDMEELINCDKVLCMENGKLAKFCKLDDLLEDYEFLKKNKLDLPFTLKLSKILKEKKLNVNLTLNDNDLVEQLCKKF